MPVKIRLARHGRKRNAYYHIVAADSRAPRDGKFIERLGSYNPNTNPATIELDFERALEWLQKGAQPTDTAKAILSYKGVLMKKHLLDGVRKGAFDEAAAEEKYNKWTVEKAAKIQAKVDGLIASQSSDSKARMEAERKVSDDRAQGLAEKSAALAKEAADAAKAEADAIAAEKAAKEAPVAKAEVEAAPEVEATPEVEAAPEAEEKTEE